MKVITGIIRNIVETHPEPGYDSKNGYIYTFDMTIENQQGKATAEIGSKSQSYPMNNGDEITVEASQTDHGPRFKKINPQYSGQPGGGGQQKGDDNKDRLIVAQVVFKALAGTGRNCSEQVLAEAVDMIMRVGEGKPAPQGGDPNPEYSENPEEPTDGIPF